MGKSIEIIFIEELERRGLQEEADNARVEFLVLGREILIKTKVLHNSNHWWKGLTDKEILCFLIAGNNSKSLLDRASRYLAMSRSCNEFITSEQLRRANSIARKFGTNKATSIIIGDEDKVIDHTHPGYRKYTTGEYVPNAYRSNFGWKNTYYQHAETTVMVKGT